jgi:hypothetical protein
MTGPAPRPFARIDLLSDEHPVEGGKAEAAVLGRHVEVHQAELVRVRDHLRGVSHLGVVLGFTRPDLAFRERVGEPAQLLLLLGQGERNACRRSLVDRDHQASAVPD